MLFISAWAAADFFSSQEEGAFGFYLYQCLIWTAPFCLSVAAYFTFYRYDRNREELAAEFIPPFLLFVMLFASTLFFQTFVTDSLTVSRFMKQWESEKVTLDRIIQKRKNIAPLMEVYRSDPAGAYRETLERLEELEREFPFDTEVVKAILEVKRKSYEGSLGSGGEKISDTASRLERDAIEKMNGRDYAGAWTIYQRLLRIYPDRSEFTEKLVHYRQMARLCWMRQSDIEAQLPTEEMQSVMINRELEKIDRLMEEKTYKQAYARAKILYAVYPGHSRLQQTFSAIERKIREMDFSLTALFYHRRFLPDKSHFDNLSFQNQGNRFTLERVYPYPYQFFAEGVFIRRQDGSKAFYRYGLIRSDVMMAKDTPEEMSEVLPGNFNLFMEHLPFAETKRDPLYRWASVPFLIKGLSLQDRGAAERESHLHLLINLKINAIILAMGLFFFYTQISWINRRRLLSLASLLFWPLSSVVILGGFFFWINGLARLTDDWIWFHIGASLLSVSFFAGTLLGFLNLGRE